MLEIFIEVDKKKPLPPNYKFLVASFSVFVGNERDYL